jgi:hypothetical protein
MGDHITGINLDTNFFFNTASDTILLRSNASVNDTWLLMKLQNKSFIEATVDSIVQMTVAGITDSVKCISFIAKDSLGNMISNHPANSLSIWLSKSNGFLKSLCWRELPDNFVSLERIQNITIPTWGQMFDYNINDEFEYTRPGPPNYSYRKIISKSFSPTMDTITYYYTSIIFKTTFNSIPTPHLDTSIVYRTDTLIITDLGKPFYSTYPEENKYPDLDNYTLSKDSTNYNGRPIFSQISKFIYYEPFDSCYALNHFEPSIYTSIYSPGIGELYFESDDRASGGLLDWRKLVWFRKGSETWGTFIPLVTGTNNLQKNLKVTISPNPVSDNCTIAFSEYTSLTLSLFDLTGRELQKFYLSGNTLDINLASLPAGVYFLKASDNLNQFSYKILKL